MPPPRSERAHGVLSTFADRDPVAKEYARGPDAYISKSVDPKAVARGRPNRVIARERRFTEQTVGLRLWIFIASE